MRSICDFRGCSDRKKYLMVYKQGDYRTEYNACEKHKNLDIEKGESGNFAIRGGYDRPTPQGAGLQ